MLGIVNAASSRPISKIAPPVVLAGGMASAIDWAATRNTVVQRPAVPAVDPDPASVETQVQRSKPRFFIPPDLVILLQGARRSFKHGSDSLYSESGNLPCRLTGSTVTSLTPKTAANLPNAGAVTGADLLERGVGNGSVPPECEALLEEIALLDPGSADVAVQSATRGATAVPVTAASQLARTYAVEQMMTFVNRDPRRDIAPLTAISGFTGTLPPGASVAAPISPWIPLHIDWDVDYIPSPGGMDDWILKEVDFDADPDHLPPVEGTVPVQNYKGRALLTGGVAKMAAAAVRQALDRAQRSGGSVSLQPGFNWAFNSKAAQVLLSVIQPLRANSVILPAPGRPPLPPLPLRSRRHPRATSTTSRRSSKALMCSPAPSTVSTPNCDLASSRTAPRRRSPVTPCRRISSPSAPASCASAACAW